MVYGIQKDNLPKPQNPVITNLGWGELSKCLEEDNFSLYLLRVKKHDQGSQTLLFLEDTYFYLDEGQVELNILRRNEFYKSDLASKKSIKILRNDTIEINCLTASKIFLFTSVNLLNKFLFKELDLLCFDVKNNPESLHTYELFDMREKYWGKIQSIFSEETMAGKIMYVNKGTCGSLEYHLNKYESYYVDKGKVEVGLRIGRAQNTSVTINEGHTFSIFPGLMHCRIGIENCKIIEISTKDEDSDSYLVEDGNKYNHKVDI